MVRVHPSHEPHLNHGVSIDGASSGCLPRLRELVGVIARQAAAEWVAEDAAEGRAPAAGMGGEPTP